MENLAPGWFNPTLLGALLIVIVTGIVTGREILKSVGSYLSTMAERAAGIDEFLKNRLESSDERHKIQLAAWQSNVVKSTEANVTLVSAFESLEKRSTERHATIIKAYDSHSKQATERHEEVIELLNERANGRD